MSRSHESSQPRFLTEDPRAYAEEMQRQYNESLDSELREFTRIPESDEVLAMDADPKDKGLPEEVKAALVLAARARHYIKQS